MIASTFIITGVGWATSSWFVERRLSRKSAEEGGPSPVDDSDLKTQHITPDEQRGLLAATIAGGVVILIILGLIFIKGAPLYDHSYPGVAIADVVKDANGQPVTPPETMNIILMVRIATSADRAEGKHGTESSR